MDGDDMKEEGTEETPATEAPAEGEDTGGAAGGDDTAAAGTDDAAAGDGDADADDTAATE
jgi:hypothetical protein